jgi:hypothetical protein
VSDLGVLEIARICFRLETQDSLQLEIDGVETAEAFRQAGPGLAGHVGVPVTVGLDLALRVPEGPARFDTGGSWRAFREGDIHTLEGFADRETSQLLWMTRFDDALGHVDVQAGPALVLDDAPPGRARCTLTYPLDQVLLMHGLPLWDGLILHAAGLDLDGRAVVFPGRSGAGKSTLTRLTRGLAEVGGLSDDRVVLRRVENRLVAFGTPWAGTERVAANRGSTLAALAFLRHASENQLQRLTPRETRQRLLPLASILWYDEMRVGRALEICREVSEQVPAFELAFRPDESVGASVRGLLSM